MRSIDKLTELDILDLLNEYHSELRKLDFKTEQVKFRVQELEDGLKNISTNATVKYQAPVSPVSPVNPVVPVSTEPEDQKKQKRKPYPLSEWDKTILESVVEAGKARISAEILDEITIRSKEKGIFKDDDDTRVKLNQHLVKLANRRGDLIKVKHKGRGFAYALPEWVDEKGRLLKEFNR
jgi:hypothetical protein